MMPTLIMIINTSIIRFPLEMTLSTFIMMILFVMPPPIMMINSHPP